ncbi:MAG: glycosyltransferase family 4 protein [Armatimonadota bacterium]|nr:glycosyltransferase family 4 protein [Armatimonadota bacterium]MDR7544788.1 glycosyltransferase family 4 protein [Armatimonadota bacterium]
MPRRRLRVWVVTPELHRHGGTERCLAELVERWRDRFDLRLYTMRADGVDLTGIPVRRIPWLPGPHLVRYIWWYVANTILRRWDALRLGAPDVVHSPGVNCPDADSMSVHIVFAKYWERTGPATWRSLLRRRTAARAAHRILYWALVRRLERVAYSGAATIWAISREDARELENRFNRPPGTVVAIPHGVDARIFSPDARVQRRAAARARMGLGAERVLLLVGNDAVKKGVDTAVRALASLPPDVVLAVAGRVDADLVKRWSREAGVADRVRLWPHNPEVLDYYAAADVFIAPSREDAFHLPAMEALACGLPDVVSAKTGAAELMEDGRHALVLRDPEDSSALAVLVRCILDDSSLAERLGREGRALAERLSWDANAERAAALLERETTTPRVLVLAPHAWGTGGIERCTRTLVRALADLYGAERIGLLSVWGGPGVLPCRVLWKGPEARGAGRVPWTVKVRFVLAAARLARRWRRRLVVVACHPHLAPVAWLAARAAGARWAVWCHGREVWRPVRPAVRAALRRADLVVAPSRFTAGLLERMHRVPPARLAVLPHALPPDLPLAEAGVAGGATAGEGGLRVLTVARLVPEHAYKGVDTLLAAWPLVLRSVPEAELVVVGDGPDRPRLEREAARLVLDGRVRFAGHLDDRALAEAYTQAAVFALPARTRVGRGAAGEGFGLVFLEAAAAGLPVVAGNGGAIPEVVRDGETGLLVDPESPEAVAAAIVRLLRDPDLARRLGEAGRRLAREEFSYERFRERLAGLIEGLRRPA